MPILLALLAFLLGGWVVYRLLDREREAREREGPVVDFRRARTAQKSWQRGTWSAARTLAAQESEAAARRRRAIAALEERRLEGHRLEKTPRTSNESRRK